MTGSGQQRGADDCRGRDQDEAQRPATYDCRQGKQYQAAHAEDAYCDRKEFHWNDAQLLHDRTLTLATRLAPLRENTFHVRMSIRWPRSSITDKQQRTARVLVLVRLVRHLQRRASDSPVVVPLPHKNRCNNAYCRQYRPDLAQEIGPRRGYPVKHESCRKTYCGNRAFIGPAQRQNSQADAENQSGRQSLSPGEGAEGAKGERAACGGDSAAPVGMAPIGEPAHLDGEEK